MSAISAFWVIIFYLPSINNTKISIKRFHFEIKRFHFNER
jgi:hypothetical protein